MTQALFSQLEVKQTHYPRELQLLPAKRGWLCNYVQHHSPGNGPCIDFTHCYVPSFPCTAVREGDGNCLSLAVSIEQSVGLNTVCLEIQVAKLQEASVFFLLGRKLIVSPQIVQEGRLCGFYYLFHLRYQHPPPSPKDLSCSKQPWSISVHNYIFSVKLQQSLAHSA